MARIARNKRKHVSWQLSQTDKKLLLRLQKEIVADADFSVIEKSCKEVSKKISEKLFPYAYAGLLLAAHNRIDEAKKLLSIACEYTFCRVVEDYLKDHGHFNPVTVAFSDPRPYTVFSTTSMYKSY